MWERFLRWEFERVGALVCGHEKSQTEKSYATLLSLAISSNFKWFKIACGGFLWNGFSVKQSVCEGFLSVSSKYPKILESLVSRVSIMGCLRVWTHGSESKIECSQHPISMKIFTPTPHTPKYVFWPSRAFERSKKGGRSRSIKIGRRRFQREDGSLVELVRTRSFVWTNHRCQTIYVATSWCEKLLFIIFKLWILYTHAQVSYSEYE